METLNLPLSHLGLEMWVCVGNATLSMPYKKDLKCVMRKLMKTPWENESSQILKEDKNGNGGGGHEDNIMIKQIESCGATSLLPGHQGLADCLLASSVSGMQHHFSLSGWEEGLSPWRCACTSVIWECQIQPSSFATVFISSLF